MFMFLPHHSRQNHPRTGFCLACYWREDRMRPDQCTAIKDSNSRRIESFTNSCDAISNNDRKLYTLDVMESVATLGTCQTLLI